MGRGSQKSLDWKSVREAAVEALDEIPDDQEHIVKRDYYAVVYQKYYTKTGHKMHYKNHIPVERILHCISENFLNDHGWKSCSRQLMVKHLEGNHLKAVRCIKRLIS